MSESNLAPSLRREYLEHASEEDKPFFEMMDDRYIIERMLTCSLCERRVLAYDMAIIANTVEELGGLIEKFGDQAHLAECVPMMEHLGSEGLYLLKLHREEQEEEEFRRDIAHYQSLFEEHKHELLDLMAQDGENGEEEG